MTTDQKASANETLKDINVSKIKKAVLFKTENFSISKQKIEQIFRFQKCSEQLVEMRDNTSQEEVTAEIVEKTQETVTKQRSKKKRWISTIFLLINLGIVVGILLWNFLGNEDSMSLSELLTQQINWWWLLVGVGVFILVNFLDAARVFIMIFFCTKRPRPFLSYKSAAICRFYDSITPMATGGQPFQIFYLKKRGLPTATATSVPLAKYLYSQFFFIIFVAIVLICQYATIVQLNPYILTLCYIGFGLNVLLIGSILFLSSSKKIAPACAVGILKLLSKMRIVKDYRKSFVKVMHTSRDYVTTMRQFISNGWIALLMFIASGIFMVVNYTIPFVVYATFVPLGADWLSIWLELFTIAVVCDLACCFIPTPGATGLAEVSFAVLFMSFFSAGVIVWALLLWRIYTYYGNLIQGLLVMLYDFIIGNKKIEPLLNRFKKEDKEKEEKEGPVIKVKKGRIK